MRIIEAAAVLTRRTLLAGLAAAMLAPRMAFALTVAQAQAFVAQISTELARLVNSGQSGSALYATFKGILSRYGDMAAVGASVLGPPWRSASNAQRAAFVSAFEGYLARKYGQQFEDFRNARIEVRGGRDAGRAGVLVSTVVVRPGRDSMAVDWQVSDRSGAPRAINLIIEGVSLLANERAEVGAMLEAQGGDLDELIAQLRARS
jgi:phospholipid transport system substrate-binding protein